MEEDFGETKQSFPLISEGEDSVTAEILEFPNSTHERPYDPLVDHDVLEMLREWYKSGEAVVFPKDVECYRAHRDAVEALSDKDVEELGLKFPCHMIRSPATEASQKVDEFRIRLGVWEMRTTNIIIGAWLFNRDVDRDILQQLMPDSNFDRMIPKLVEGGLVTIRGNGRIVPSRLLLYREMEQVVWLIDTLTPIVSKYKFGGAIFSEKMGDWPPVDEEVPCYG